MNQIEKKKIYPIQPGDTPAYDSVVYVSNKQVSRLIALLILAGFCIFTTGYFLGQRTDCRIQSIASADMLMPAEISVAQNEQELDASSRAYKAQLIGFGTMRAAQQFAERLQHKNLPVRVQERYSKTAQGKEVIWYQVTTEQFNDKQELAAFVDKIKKEERLKDIRIIAC